MAVMITESGKQSFMDNQGVHNLARSADTVKLTHKGPMQNQYTLTMTYTDEGELHTTSCEIVANVPSEADDMLNIAMRVRK